MIKIKSLDVKSIGPIEKLNLTFNEKFNIICGQNGIGKTTILDILSQSFSVNQTTVKKKVGAENGQWNIEVQINSNIKNRDFKLNSFLPNERTHSSNGFYENSEDIIVFKTHRDIPYRSLNSINVDPVKNNNNFSNETVNGSLPNNLKNWFVHRHLWSIHEDHLEKEQLKNYELAKECFSILNTDISFSKVKPDTNDILINTPSGEIYFEYLSSGYKSCLAILLGLIHEVEYRFKNPSKFIGDFDGVIFIDEIDLHLHPEWQAQIYFALKKILPNAQFFTSTHSPHLLQVADPKEIIALNLNDKNSITINELVNNDYGYQGWSLEEILTEIMGMKETRSEVYLEQIKKFNNGLDDEDISKANEAFDVLDKMLHPSNSLRKILKIQLIGLE